MTERLVEILVKADLRKKIRKLKGRLTYDDYIRGLIEFTQGETTRLESYNKPTERGCMS